MVAPGLAGHAQAQATRRVAGVVERAVGDTAVPLADAWVVLHRVGRDTAGALDSVRTDPRGRYALQYRATGDSGAVYFASATHHGVAYFSAPLRGGDVRGEAAGVLVFDTSSVGVPVRTRGRHILVFSIGENRTRRILEVYEIENVSSRTRVAAAGRPTWSAMLPGDATDVQVDAPDVPADAAVVRNGRVEVNAPLSPGLRQLTIVYALPASHRSVAIPVTDSVTVLEVLLQDASASVSGVPFTPQPAITMEGRPFQRFLAQDVAAGPVVTVALPRGGGSVRVPYIAIVLVLAGLAMLVGLSRAAFAPGGLRLRRAAPPDDAERLAREIAALEAKFVRRSSPTAEERVAYETERARLRDELTRVLAEREPQF